MRAGFYDAHLRYTPSPRGCWYPVLAVRSSTGRVLRGQPFFGTRRQQLSYRVMLVQGFLVAVLFGTTVAVDLFYVVGHLLRQEAVPGASTGFTMVNIFWRGECSSPILVSPLPTCKHVCTVSQYLDVLSNK